MEEEPLYWVPNDDDSSDSDNSHDKSIVSRSSQESTESNNISASNYFQAASSKGFDIVTNSLKNVEEIKEIIPPLDDNIPLFKARDMSNATTSKGDFSRDINSFVKSFQLPKNAVKSLTNIIGKHFPVFKGFNIPIKINKCGTGFNEQFETYSTNSNCKFEFFDICPVGGCCVFVGENENKVECTICGAKRYYHCTKNKCRGQDYNFCKHILTKRRPKKSLAYRSLIVLFTELVKLEGFIHAINYKNINNENGYKDVMDSENPKNI